MRREIVNSLLAVVVLTVAFGIAYPLLTTGVAQVLFPGKADGSRVEVDGETVGSTLIAQEFSRPAIGPNGAPEENQRGRPVFEPDPSYFQSRPSVTGYDPAATAFNNLGPNSADLRDQLEKNRDAYLELERRYDPALSPADVPVDAVNTSASGVDPHISQANARIQAARVAEERRLPLETVLDLVDEHTDGRALGVLGEPGVNVVELNLALDQEDAS